MINFTHPINQVRDFARSNSDVLLASTGILAVVCAAFVVVAVCIACRHCRGRCTRRSPSSKRPPPSASASRSNTPGNASRYRRIAPDSSDGSRCSTAERFIPRRRPATPSSLSFDEPDGGRRSTGGGTLIPTIPQFQPTVIGRPGNDREEHPYIRTPGARTPTGRTPARATTTTTPPQSPTATTTPGLPYRPMRPRSASLDRMRIAGLAAGARQKTESPLVSGGGGAGGGGGGDAPLPQRTTQSNPPQPTQSRLDPPRLIGRRIGRHERSQSCSERAILDDVEQLDRSERLRKQSLALVDGAHSLTSLESLDLGSPGGTPTRELYRRRPVDADTPTPTSSCPQTPTFPDDDDVVFVAPKKSLARVKLTFYYTAYNRTLSVLNLECFDLIRSPSASHTFIAKVSSSADAHRKERTSPAKGAANPFFFHDVVRLGFDTADDVVSSTLKVELYLVHFTLGPLHREKKVAIGSYQLAASRDVELVNNVTCDLLPVRSQQQSQGDGHWD